MAFHTTSTGQVSPCTASVRSCPLAPADEHYATAGEAARALALEALERQADYQLALPEGWGQLVDEPPAPPRAREASAAASSLTVDDFAAFAASEANRSQPVKEDWRETIARNAALNGDAHADSNPDRSVSGYWDASADEFEPFPELEPF